MKRFLRELRRREVYSTTGLYIGFCWIVIEAASILLPTFDAPEWVLRFILIAAVVGFPIMLVLAWFLDVSGDSIHVQDAATARHVAPLGSRRMDFVVIGVLLVALLFSLSLNLTGGDAEPGMPEPVSILVAGVEYPAGDAEFEGALEYAFATGLEAAPFIDVYSPGASRAQISTLGARQFATELGADLLLTASMARDGDRLKLDAQLTDVVSNAAVADAQAEAAGADEVLFAVARITAELRNELGDDEADSGLGGPSSGGWLQAAQRFAEGEQLRHAGDTKGALRLYEAAAERYPAFGTAYVGMTIAPVAHRQQEQVALLLEPAMLHVASMPARQRLLVKGLHHRHANLDPAAAVEVLEQLVNDYPAEFDGWLSLAEARSMMPDPGGALAATERALDIYPGDRLARTQNAIYAMQHGDLTHAVSAAERLRQDIAPSHETWLPAAIQAMARADFHTARLAYRRMSDLGPQGAGIAALGLADVALFTAEFAAAKQLLVDLPGSEAPGDDPNRAVRTVMLAEALLGQGDREAAVRVAAEAAAASDANAVLVPAALVALAAGDGDAARAVAGQIAGKSSPHARAYAQLVEALVLAQNGEHLPAIETFNRAIRTADLWLIRFHLGLAYLEGGFPVEAIDEFTIVGERHGEATLLFFDGRPTYRYTATLPYWLARAQGEVGMQAAASENYAAFIERRAPGDALAQDAAARLRR